MGEKWSFGIPCRLKEFPGPELNPVTPNQHQRLNKDEAAMNNRLLGELKELDITITKLVERRTDVSNILKTLDALSALEPGIGAQIDKVLSDTQSV
jgi:hypothetical protein